MDAETAETTLPAVEVEASPVAEVAGRFALSPVDFELDADGVFDAHGRSVTDFT